MSRRIRARLSATLPRSGSGAARSHAPKSTKETLENEINTLDYVASPRAEGWVACEVQHEIVSKRRRHFQMTVRGAEVQRPGANASRVAQICS